MADGGERTSASTASTTQPASAAPRRVVLLGASNLTRGISTVVETARRVCGSPLEILTALGHGRSYGMTSSVLGRRLPGILQCGLWDALAALPPAPTAALVTDVGNDIVYGASVETILSWIDECVSRLEANMRSAGLAGDRQLPIVLTLVPRESLAAISKWRFTLVRSLAFPGCRLSRNAAISRAESLDEGLQAIAARRGLHTMRPRIEWYGFDPIHIRRRHWSPAWSEILSPWNAPTSDRIPLRASPARWLYLRSRAPLRRTVFGIEQRAAQPSGRLRDGTTIAIY
jgi:hypothetical protein